MSDFSSITIGYNTGSDGAPNWANTALAFGGTAGANELRFADLGAGATATTASANWPYSSRPTVGTATVRQLWAFTADAVGLQVNTYDGTNGKSNVLRLVFSNDGTLASAPRITSFQDAAHTPPTPGLQVSNPGNGSNIVNGQATDTTSTSYMKGNAYGSGLTAAGAQETPAAGTCGTNMLANSGTAGSVSPSAGSWLTTWQSMQGWTQYITAPAIPKATTAFNWYVNLVLFFGANIVPGTMPFAPLTFDYTYA